MSGGTAPPILNPVPDGGERSTSRHDRLTPRGKQPLKPTDQEDGSERFGKEKRVLAVAGNRTPHFQANSLVTTETTPHLSRNLVYRI